MKFQNACHLGTLKAFYLLDCDTQVIRYVAIVTIGCYLPEIHVPANQQTQRGGRYGNTENAGHDIDGSPVRKPAQCIDFGVCVITAWTCASLIVHGRLPWFIRSSGRPYSLFIWKRPRHL